MESIFFCGVVRWAAQRGGAVAMTITHHGLDLLLVIALLESLLKLILGGHVGGIVLVYLSLQSAPWSSPFQCQAVHTRLYEFSRKVAILEVS